MTESRTDAPAPAARHMAAGTEPVSADRSGSLGSKLNALRAAVLGANDGVTSTSGLLLGVAGANADKVALLIAGLAGLFAGAFAMGGGEYVSVSSQRDTERSMIEEERRKLASDPDGELEVLASIYREKGISDHLAHQVARELTAHDAIGAHAEAKLGIDPDEFTSPWQAAIASMLSFTAGSLIPLITIMLVPSAFQVPATIVAVLVALFLTGYISGRLSGAHPMKVVLRNVIVGVLAMGVTYLIGRLVGRAV